MTPTDSNLRKAAVLLRSLDGDTAAVMLAQLSPAQTSSLRAAIRDLGAIDPDEQADVVAEFRRTRPAAASCGNAGVELNISSPIGCTPEAFPAPAGIAAQAGASRRFEFLASTSTGALVTYLAREHAQTIAVVLSHLAPARAAAVLAALPAKLQADTVERLSALGATDPESVTALERELAAWMATRTEDRGMFARCRETVANILAAADPKTRRGILSSIKSHNAALAQQLSSNDPEERGPAKPKPSDCRYESRQACETTASIRARLAKLESPIADPLPVPPRPAQLPRIDFEQLVQLDEQALTAVLREVDPNVLAIALAGSSDELVDRICGQMPKRTGRAFHRELRRLGPMRISDVEVAQRAVAEVAAKYLYGRRTTVLART
jgi:flagellar motor switch protein FliG